jgi:hypothetical protein
VKEGKGKKKKKNLVKHEKKGNTKKCLKKHKTNKQTKMDEPNSHSFRQIVVESFSSLTKALKQWDVVNTSIVKCASIVMNDSLRLRNLDSDKSWGCFSEDVELQRKVRAKIERDSAQNLQRFAESIEELVILFFSFFFNSFRKRNEF